MAGVWPRKSRGGREGALTGQFRGRIELRLGLSASKETPLMGQKRGALLDPHTMKAPGIRETSFHDPTGIDCVRQVARG